MSDSDKNLEILIKTRADLTGAKAAETQLEQDIAKARELGDAYDSLENRLKAVRAAIDAHQRSSEMAKVADGAPAEAVRDDFDKEGRRQETEFAATGSKPLGWLKAGVEGLRFALEAAMPKLFGPAKSPVATSAESPDKTFVEGRRPVTDRPDITAAVAVANEAEEPGGRWNTQAAEARAGAVGRQGGESFGQEAEGRAQAIQVVGEKLRVALEQNSQVSVSLFNRMLELMDQQNRKLGEVDRRIAELGGQIKSLKNL